MRYSFCSPARIYVLCLIDVTVLIQSHSSKTVKSLQAWGAGLCDPIPYSMILSTDKSDIGSMTKKEKVMKLVDESTGLMECLVCGAKHNAVMKPGPDGKYLPENWECVNRCKLIHHEEKSSKKK
jgi:hypothetical protein